MQVKLLEIRDDATCIAAIAIKPGVKSVPGRAEDQLRRLTFLLGKSGFKADPHENAVGLTFLAGREPLHFDPYDWRPGTMQTAHVWLEDHFDELSDGALIDVRVIDGRAKEPAQSDAFYGRGS